MRRTIMPRVAGLLFVVGLSTALPSAAFAADNMYPTGNARWTCFDGDFGYGRICQTDNKALTVYMQDSVSAARKTTITNMLGKEFAPTNLSVSHKSSGTYSGDAETDLIYQVSSSGFSGTTIGRTWCNDAVTGQRCDQAYVRFRGISFDTELACHETGHAVGLTHGEDAFPALSNRASELGCMETPDSGTRPGLGAHNRSEINATYTW